MKLGKITGRYCAFAIAAIVMTGLQMSAAPVFSRSGSPFIIDYWDAENGLPHNTVTTIIQTRDGYLWLGTLGGMVRFDGQRLVVFDENNTPGLPSGRVVKLFEDRRGFLWVGTETAGVLLVKDGEVTQLGIGQGAFEKRLVSICEDSSAVWLAHANGELWRWQDGKLSPFLFGWERPSALRCVITDANGMIWVGNDWRYGQISPLQAAGAPEPQLATSVTVRKLDGLAAASKGFWRLAEGKVQLCSSNGVERECGPYPWGAARVGALLENKAGELVVGTLGAGIFWVRLDGSHARLSRADGLSSDYVLALCEDREGNLWVGTDGGGVNRIKPKVFEVLDFSTDGAGGAVQSVCVDGQGRLWVGANNGGVTCLQGEQSIRYGPAQGLLNPNVWSVWASRQTGVWAGTWGGGLYHLANGRFQRAIGLDGIHRDIHALCEDSEGRLWLGSQNGLACLDGGQWKTIIPNATIPPIAVYALAPDLKGGLWIGTVKGLIYYNKRQFTNYYISDGLPSDEISALWLDNSGALWIGTLGGGLGRFDGQRFTRFSMRHGLASNQIYYFLEDGNGHLWIGSSAGLLRVSKRELEEFAYGKAQSFNCRAYGKAEGLPTRECSQGSQPGACRTDDGQLWFATSKGLVKVRPEQLKPNIFPPPVAIESVLVDGAEQFKTGLRRKIPREIVVSPGWEHLEIHYTSLGLSAAEQARFRYRLEGHEKGWVEAGGGRVARYSKVPPGRYQFHVTACNEDGIWNQAGCILDITIAPPFWRTGWFMGSSVAALLLGLVAAVRYISTRKLQRQLTSMLQKEAVEKERSRIARDIHDQIGASLTQIALLGEMLEADSEDSTEVKANASQISQTARETTKALDEIVWTVNPANDTLEGLATYLCKHAQEYLAVAGIGCRFEAPDQLPAIMLSPELRHNVFLAAKEAITNVVRHSKASMAWIRVRFERGELIIEIQDNGRGFAGRDEARAGTRSGLNNMKKRMLDVGGDCSIIEPPEGGLIVRLRVALGKP